MELTTAEREIIAGTLLVVQAYVIRSKWNDNEYHVRIGRNAEGQVQSIEEFMGEGDQPAYLSDHLSLAEAIKKIETNSDVTIITAVSLYDGIAAAWLPQTKPVAIIEIHGVQVEIHANDDRGQYEARINGAVCAVQTYDGIRMDQADPEFSSYLAEIFQDGAQRARGAYVRGLGPIYV